MPFGDPGGNFAAGNSFNGGSAPGSSNFGGNGSQGQNFSSAHQGSSPNQIGTSGTMKFGWQPNYVSDWGMSPDQLAAFNNPNAVNYADNPMIGRGGSSTSMGGFFNGIGRGTVPGGAGGSNSGQGGMGAGNLGNGILSMLMQSYAQPRKFRANRGHRIG